MIRTNFFTSPRRRKGIKYLEFFLIFASIYAVYLMIASSVEDGNSVRKVAEEQDWREILKKLAPGSPENCTELFKGLTTKDIFSEQYRWRLNIFKKKLHEVLLEKNVVGIEGHSGQLPQQQMFYWLLARQPHVKTICEIGFNAGHSALLWLSAKENVTLYSFDINQHRYTQPMAEYLKAHFPGLFYIVYGPSVMTVPIVSQTAQFKCDISVIDGAHTKDMAMDDVINMRKLSDEKTLVIIDDTAKDSRGRRNEVNEALSDMVRRNIVNPLYSCGFQMSSRGFAFLSYKDEQ